MTLEQLFVKCLYIAYKKNMNCFVQSFHLIDNDGLANDNIYKATYDNSIWSELTDAEIRELIDEDPSAGYDALYKYISDDIMGFNFFINDMILCTKSEIGVQNHEFNEANIMTFLKEFECSL